MNEQDWIDLGKRAVACDGWRWIAGMRGRWLDLLGSPRYPRMKDHDMTPWFNSPSATPDLRDPATLGCLLHLVREAWRHLWDDGEDRLLGLVVCIDGHDDRDWWVVEDHEGCVYARGKTEAEALVAALEAAPKEEVSNG